MICTNQEMIQTFNLQKEKKFIHTKFGDAIVLTLSRPRDFVFLIVAIFPASDISFRCHERASLSLYFCFRFFISSLLATPEYVGGWGRTSAKFRRLDKEAEAAPLCISRSGEDKVCWNVLKRFLWRFSLSVLGMVVFMLNRCCDGGCGRGRDVKSIEDEI